MDNIHPLADVKSNIIGKDTKVWQYSIIFSGAKIGNNCNICAHTMIEDDVLIGDNVSIKNGVFLWDGTRVENDVFIGPNATFANDRFPRSKQAYISGNTIIKKGASIGAGAIIISDIEIGQYAMVGAGAVVTKNVPEYAVVVGNPARVIGTVTDYEKYSSNTISTITDNI